MSHYFETPAELGPIREISATIFGNELTFQTAPGVFSGNRLDLGTSVLLRTVDPPTRGQVLDLGCGFGPIAVGIAKAGTAEVDAVDINEVALELTRRNAGTAGVAASVRVQLPDSVPKTNRYDEIWSNPPIRIGKAALHELLLRWLPRLKPSGVAYLVVSKNLGGDSLAVWLRDEGFPTTKLASAKGFRVLRCGSREH